MGMRVCVCVCYVCVCVMCVCVCVRVHVYGALSESLDTKSVHERHVMITSYKWYNLI